MRELILSFGRLIDRSIVILVGVALLVFLWGVAMFIFKLSKDDKAVEGGKRLMKWGVVALFVMVCVWGLVKFMQSALDLPVTVENTREDRAREAIDAFIGAPIDFY